jgi:hypothetical protein
MISFDSETPDRFGKSVPEPDRMFLPSRNTGSRVSGICAPLPFRRIPSIIFPYQRRKDSNLFRKIYGCERGSPWI